MPFVKTSTGKTTLTLSPALRAFVRLILRLIASGALTAAVDQITGGLSPVIATLVLSGWASVLTYAQVHVEDKTGKSIGVAPPASQAALNTVSGQVN